MVGRDVCSGPRVRVTHYYGQAILAAKVTRALTGREEGYLAGGRGAVWLLGMAREGTLRAIGSIVGYR